MVVMIIYEACRKRIEAGGGQLKTAALSADDNVVI